MPFKENGTRINCRELVGLQPEERMSQSKEKLTIPPDKVEVKRGQFLKILPGCGQRAMTNTSEDEPKRNCEHESRNSYPAEKVTVEVTKGKNTTQENSPVCRIAFISRKGEMQRKECVLERKRTSCSMIDDP